MLFLSVSRLVDATVYIHNATSGGKEPIAAYPSLPALFGAQFLEGHVYTARLQYLVENPFLCEQINLNKTSFVGEIIGPASAAPGLPKGEGDDNEEGDPIVMLAARGSCPFHLKAMVAESLGMRVQYLIIYNHNYDGEDVLVPMNSEYGNSRLKLLSVTHRTGTALKRYIADAPPDERAQGGPEITMDNVPPDGIMTAEDLQDVMISTLGLFFMLVSCSGCFLMCAAAAQHGRRLNHLNSNNSGSAGGEDGNQAPSPLWMILMGEGDTDQVMVGDPAAATRVLGARTLLTTAEVEKYLVESQFSGSQYESNVHSSPAAASKAPEDEDSDPKASSKMNIQATHEETSTPEESPDANPLHCAICLDDIDENVPGSVLQLPCSHKFHTDCIIPWLTERQSKCPLCKYDVLNYVRERAAENPVAATFSAVNLRRRRLLSNLFFGGSGSSWYFPQQSLWMAVRGNEHEEQERGGGEEDTEVDESSAVAELDAELELAEAQSTRTSDISNTTESTRSPSLSHPIT